MEATWLHFVLSGLGAALFGLVVNIASLTLVCVRDPARTLARATMQRFGTAVWLLLLDFAGGVAAGLVAFATRIPKDALDMITEHPALGYALIGVGGVLET